MKIVNTIGGLGNQMFCYAFALALKEKHNEKVFVDISHFNNYGLHDGFLINEIFNVQEINIASKKEIKSLSRYIPHYKLSRIFRKLLPKKSTEYIEKQDYVYDNLAMSVKGDCYYEGYWQSPLYFDNIKPSVKKMFTFPKSFGENKDIEVLMGNVDSVSIHVRRGDYLNHKSFVGICELDYYERAINNVKKKIKDPHYFIFSNDIVWCKENLSSILDTDKVQFVSHNQGSKSFWDMYLMSCSKNMIIANSSFSWWAAYLNQYDNAYIISPVKWVNRSYNTDVHPSSWVLI